LQTSWNVFSVSWQREVFASPPNKKSSK
jgi:hypothetical protein